MAAKASALGLADGWQRLIGNRPQPENVSQNRTLPAEPKVIFIKIVLNP
ncbi:hypothetical protein ACLIKD_19280 [Azonexus sp. IMCC34842]|jgi:hypothetical protein